jgi:hypothetical protein
LRRIEGSSDESSILLKSRNHWFHRRALGSAKGIGGSLKYCTSRLSSMPLLAAYATLTFSRSVRCDAEAVETFGRGIGWEERFVAAGGRVGDRGVERSPGREICCRLEVKEDTADERDGVIPEEANFASGCAGDVEGREEKPARRAALVERVGAGGELGGVVETIAVGIVGAALVEVAEERVLPRIGQAISIGVDERIRRERSLW